EERRGPAVPEGKRLARSREGEAEEACRPEQLLPRASTQPRRRQSRGEQQREEGCRQREQRISNLRRRPVPVRADRRRFLSGRNDAEVVEVTPPEHAFVRRHEGVAARA